MKEAGIEHSRMWLTFLKLIPFSVGKTLRQGEALAWSSLHQPPHSDQEVPSLRVAEYVICHVVVQEELSYFAEDWLVLKISGVAACGM